MRSDSTAKTEKLTIKPRGLVWSVVFKGSSWSAQVHVNTHLLTQQSISCLLFKWLQETQISLPSNQVVWCNAQLWALYIILLDCLLTASKGSLCSAKPKTLNSILMSGLKNNDHWPSSKHSMSIRSRNPIAMCRSNPNNGWHWAQFNSQPKTLWSLGPTLVGFGATITLSLFVSASMTQPTAPDNNDNLQVWKDCHHSSLQAHLWSQT